MFAGYHLGEHSIVDSKESCRDEVIHLQISSCMQCKAKKFSAPITRSVSYDICCADICPYRSSPSLSNVVGDEPFFLPTADNLIG